MPSLYATAEEFKRRLLVRERAAASELVRAYALTVRRIEARLADLQRQIAVAQLAGEVIDTGWLYERNRLQNLQREIVIEISRFSQAAGLMVNNERLAAQGQARADARALLAEATGALLAVNFGTLNSTAVRNAAGLATDGSSVRQLFAERGARVSSAVSDELVSGVAEGAGARVIARRIRQVTGSELSRALTIARTETLRAYRESSRQTYAASGVVTGYRWLATKSGRTCLVCLALDGRVFPLKRPMPAHISCRCNFTPVLEGDDERERETAAEWFAAQSEGAQAEALGPRAFASYQAGKLELKDFVGFKRSARWGTTAYQRPLKEILANLQE